MLSNFSNPLKAAKNAQKYGIPLLKSSRKDKKYMVLTPKGKFVHFGQMGYEDFTKHKDLKRKEAYLKRATKIKGDWKKDPYSANNLTINILWI